MAGSRIKGITVEIDGDTTKLQTALKGVNSEIKNTQSQLTQTLFISTFLRKLQIDFAASNSYNSYKCHTCSSDKFPVELPFF